MEEKIFDKVLGDYYMYEKDEFTFVLQEIINKNNNEVIGYYRIITFNDGYEDPSKSSGKYYSKKEGEDLIKKFQNSSNMKSEFSKKSPRKAELESGSEKMNWVEQNPTGKSR